MNSRSEWKSIENKRKNKRAHEDRIELMNITDPDTTTTDTPDEVWHVLTKRNIRTHLSKRYLPLCQESSYYVCLLCQESSYYVFLLCQEPSYYFKGYLTFYVANG